MDRDDDDADKTPRAKTYKHGNVGPDGTYIVGKGRPPKHGGLVTVLRRSRISLCHLGFERERADAAQI